MRRGAEGGRETAGGEDMALRPEFTGHENQAIARSVHGILVFRLRGTVQYSNYVCM